jgi:anaerobic selenocysteine-containing dehydrogenase
MLETKKSFCRFCHVFCGVEVDVEDDRVVAVRGDRDNAITRGYTCQKGRAEVERINHPDRLMGAKKRVGDGFTDLPSSEALDEIALKLRDIVDTYGPESVAVYNGCAAHRSSTGGPWMARKWLDALGSPRLYTSMTIDSPSIFLAMHRFFGAPVPVNLFDIDNAEVALFVGTNPTASHHLTMPQSSPVKRMKDCRRRGMKLIVIDPRRSDVARHADIHLQVKPGEDAALLAAMVKVIIEEGAYDREYVEALCSGLEGLRQAVADFDLRYVEARTDVPGQRIRDAALMFARAETGAAQSGTGLHMARHQNLNTQLVMVLNGLCGRYDRKGGMARNPGVLNIEIPTHLGPARLPHFSGPRSRIRDIPGTFSLLGFYDEMPTNTLTDEILTPGEGQVRALIVNGGNPALVFPDEASTVRALKALDLLVVNDLFVSATATFADYVLGVKHPFERADVPRLMDAVYPIPFSQYSPALVDPPGDLLEEWEIFWELADRLGLDLRIHQSLMGGARPTSDAVLDDFHANSRIPLDEVRKHPGGHVFGDPELAAGGVIPNMIGHEDRRMALGHPELIAELREVRAEPVLESGGYEPGEEFAFRMITYRMKEVYCTQGSNLPSLGSKRSFNPCLMHPAAMASIGVAGGERVVVDSGFGQVEAIVESSEALGQWTIALAFGWGDPSDGRDVSETGCNVQRLIPDDQRFDRITGLALQSAVPVNVYPQVRGA